MAYQGGSSAAPPDAEGTSWTFPSIVAYYRADPYIAMHLSEADINNITDYDVNFIQLVKKAVEYNPKTIMKFNPAIIMKHMLIAKKRFDTSVATKRTWDLSNVNSNLASVYVFGKVFMSHGTMGRDICLLVTIYHMQKNHSSIKLSGIDDILKHLRQKYSIHACGSALNSNIVTLPRIVVCFPIFTVLLYHKESKSIKMTVSYESLPWGGTVGTLTKAICCPLLPSICPVIIVSKKTQNIHPIMFWVAIRLDDGQTTSLSDIASKYAAGYRLAAGMTEAYKIRLFRKINLINSSGSFIPDLIDLSTKCQNDLANVRTTDPDHAKIMRAIKYGDIDLL